ncbi:MAG: iron-containing alcohol dehydrogenase [Clostridia bacterium]|nr:iron-containing alcohol dehydrogenase [Clostridia bacterium]
MRFYVPVDLRVGADIVHDSADRIASFGSRFLLLTGASSAKACGALDDLCRALESKNCFFRVYDRIRQNPAVNVCKEAGLLASQMQADCIIGVGGGSALDAAKAAAVFAAAPSLDEKGLYAYSWPKAVLPVICVGTTAGTGSEVTPVSVLTDSESRKRSIRDDRLYPVLSLGDARYLTSLPRSFLYSCAVDAAAHCIESFFAKTATPISRMFASRGAAVLAQLFGHMDSLSDDEREQLYLASIYGGYAISVTGTAFPHAMGYFLTEQYSVAHGTACAVFLPAFLRHAASCIPRDTADFEKRTGLTVPDWTALLRRVTPPCGVTLTDTQIEALRPRFVRNSGISRTPGVFTDAEAVETLKEIFQ